MKKSIWSEPTFNFQSLSHLTYLFVVEGGFTAIPQRISRKQKSCKQESE